MVRARRYHKPLPHSFDEVLLVVADEKKPKKKKPRRKKMPVDK